MKSPFYIAILLVIGSQALIFSACAPYEEENNQANSASDAHQTFSVNIPCHKCVIEFPRALKKIEGIKAVNATIGTKDNFHVTFDPKKISVEQINKEIEKLGKR